MTDHVALTMITAGMLLLADQPFVDALFLAATLLVGSVATLAITEVPA